MHIYVHIRLYKEAKIIREKFMYTFLTNHFIKTLNLKYLQPLQLFSFNYIYYIGTYYLSYIIQYILYIHIIYYN